MFKTLFNRNQLTIDLICGFYILFLSSFVKDIIEAVVFGWKSTANAGVLGFVLFLMIALETYAVATKINMVFRKIDKQEDKTKLITPIILLLVLHAAITIITIIMAFYTFGYSHETYPMVLVFAIAMLFLQAFYFIRKLSFNDKSQISNHKNLFLNIVIALFSCLIFTIFWNANSPKINANNAPMMMINLFASAIFFSFFYFSLRIPFLIHRIAIKETLQEKSAFYISFLVALLPALIRLVYK